MSTKLSLLVLLLSTIAYAQSYTESIVYNFNNSNSDPRDPWGGLIMDKAGNLYGTTSAGGDAACVGLMQGTCGTVFKLDPAGNLTILHAFAGGTDGMNPIASLVMDKAGNLYGTTPYGGVHGMQGGTVFRITPSGKYGILHRFSGAPDGQNPYGSLTMDAVGNLYGTTYLGGNSTDAACQPRRGPKGCGTVFKLSPRGTETILYNFGTGPAGGLPSGNVVFDSQGNLYGTTSGGGVNDGGTLFQLTPTGTLTVLNSFCNAINCTYDGSPAFLAIDSSGNVFGSSGPNGTVTGGQGTMFEYSNAGVESTLYTFCNSFTCPSGADPYGLLLLEGGNIYGTTYEGGAGGAGEVYEMSPTGAITVLYSFGGNVHADARQPLSGVIADSAGNLYGTTIAGGNPGGGTVFKLTKD